MTAVQIRYGFALANDLRRIEKAKTDSQGAPYVLLHTDIKDVMALQRRLRIGPFN